MKKVCFFLVVFFAASLIHFFFFLIPRCIVYYISYIIRDRHQRYMYIDFLVLFKEIEEKKYFLVRGAQGGGQNFYIISLLLGIGTSNIKLIFSYSSKKYIYFLITYISENNHIDKQLFKLVKVLVILHKCRGWPRMNIPEIYGRF